MRLIGGDHALRRTRHEQFAPIEQDGRIAEAVDRSAVVRNEDQRGAAAAQLAQSLEALLLKVDVPDRERLVDDHQVGVHVDRDRERKAHEHPARVRLDRLIDEVAQFSEGRDTLVALSDLRLAHTDDGSAKEDVLATREFRIESTAELEQRRDSPVALDCSGRRRQHSRDHFEKRALSASVASDNAERLTAHDGEVERLEGREFFTRSIAEEHGV